MKTMILMLALVVLAFGCASPKVQDAAGKVLASTAVAVDGVMKGWASHVAAGRADAAQEAIVRSAFKRYQVAMSVAKTAYLTIATKPEEWEAAAAALAGSQAQLTGLVGASR